MSNTPSVRSKLRALKQVGDSPQRHDGPSFIPPSTSSDEPWQGRGIFNGSDTQLSKGWETCLVAPWNKPASVAPSPASTITSLVWTFVLSLMSGMLFTLINDRLNEATGPVTSLFLQGFILGVVIILLSWVTMSMSWHFELKTYTNFGLLASAVATSDLGIPVGLLVGAFCLIGYACGGWAAAAIGLVSLANPATIFPTTTTTGGLLLYFFGALFVMLVYVIQIKFIPYADERSTAWKRNKYAILYSSVVHGVMVIALRPMGLPFFDAGYFVSAWAAAPTLANAVADGVYSPAFYTFIPLAAGGAVFLLYLLLGGSVYASDKFPAKKDEDMVSAQYRPRY